MKKYSLFYGSYFYPGKGMEDFKGTSDDPFELVNIIEKQEGEEIWSQIYDNHERKFVLVSHDLEWWQAEKQYPELSLHFAPKIVDKVYALESLFFKKEKNNEE